VPAGRDHTAAANPAKHAAAAPRAALDQSALEDFTTTVLEATRLLHTEHIKPVGQGQLVRWAVEGLNRSLGEQVPGPLMRRLEKAKGMQEKELAVLIADARKQLGKRRALEDLKDIDHALEGIFARLEPETRQSPQRELRDRFRDVIPGYLPAGIGIRMRKIAHGDWLEVLTPVKDGPAYKAGVLAGDVITRIAHEEGAANDATLPVVSTSGLSVADAEKFLRGRPGSKVKLTIRREGVAKPIMIEVRRAQAEPETVVGVGRKADDTYDFVLDRARHIGYIRITAFGRHTQREFGRAIAGLKKEGVKGLILDLRFCPRGLIVSAFEVAERFIDGRILIFKARHGKPDVFKGQSAGSLLDFPMVCLVNGTMAGVSEALAACLQDHRRAAVAGERTPGDVGIKNIYGLDWGEIKFTTAVMIRPSGKNLSRLLTSGKETEDWGVVPDKGLALKLTPKQNAALLDHLRHQEVIPRRCRPAKQAKVEFTDRQLEMALDHLRKQLQKAK
jgi:carboxyl-terminal processing protease